MLNPAAHLRLSFILSQGKCCSNCDSAHYKKQTMTSPSIKWYLTTPILTRTTKFLHWWFKSCQKTINHINDLSVSMKNKMVQILSIHIITPVVIHSRKQSILKYITYIASQIITRIIWKFPEISNSSHKIKS